MKPVIKALMISLLILMEQVPLAAEVENLYQIEVIAKSEQEKDRLIATQQALTTVLTRILAGNDILHDESVLSILKNATFYVREYQYSLVPAGLNHNEDARMMRVLFDENLLIDILRASKLGFWNEIRPQTLVWLVVEDEGEQQFFDTLTMPEIDSAMEKAAQRKALPVLYPIQDLSEKKSLSISDVLSAYSDHLLNVSLRYDVVSTLAGKLVHAGRCWKAEWTFYFDSKIEQWRSGCTSLDEATLNGFQGVYDTLSIYYAVKPDFNEVTPTILKINNIAGINDLVRVTDYLTALPAVKTATWVGVEGDYNIYRLFFQGKHQDLINALGQDKILLAIDSPVLQSGQMRYKFLAK